MKLLKSYKRHLIVVGLLIVAALNIKMPSWAVKTRMEFSTYVPLEHNTNGFGIAQPNKEKLEEIMRTNLIAPKNFVLVDLRGEPHLLINGRNHYFKSQPFGSIEELIAFENKLADAVNDGTPVDILERVEAVEDGKRTVEFLPFEVAANKGYATTESRIAQELGLNYVRLANNDGEVPTMANVYKFITDMYPLTQDPANRIVIHCNAGRGRTSYFGIVLDMMINAKHDAFDDILSRQASRFEKDLASKGKVQSKKAVALRKIYNYIVSNDDNFQTPPAE